METYSAGTKDSRRAPWRLALLAISLGLISAHALGEDHGPQPDSKLRRIKHIIVIYQENWSFDSLFGKFPGADGIANASPTTIATDTRA